MSLGRAGEQIEQAGVQLRGDRKEYEHGGIVNAALEAPYYVGVDTGLLCEDFLTQVALLAALPYFLTETSKNCSCARHTQDWRFGQDSV